jgi:hypothetical protein
MSKTAIKPIQLLNLEEVDFTKSEQDQKVKRYKKLFNIFIYIK